MIYTFMHSACFFLLWTISLIQAFMGNISIGQSTSLLDFKIVHELCGNLVPITKTCDRSMNIVDDSCYSNMDLTLSYCEKRFQRGVESCNDYEERITNACMKSVGFINEKCGKYLDYLHKVCQLESDYQSVICDKLIRNNEKRCARFKNRISLNCRRVYEHYTNSCASSLTETYHTDFHIKALVNKFGRFEAKLRWLKREFTIDESKNPKKRLKVTIRKKLGLFRGDDMIKKSQKKESKWIDTLL